MKDFGCFREAICRLNHTANNYTVLIMQYTGAIFPIDSYQFWDYIRRRIIIFIFCFRACYIHCWKLKTIKKLLCPKCFYFFHSAVEFVSWKFDNLHVINLSYFYNFVRFALLPNFIVIMSYIFWIYICLSILAYMHYRQVAVLDRISIWKNTINKQ